MPSVKVHAHPAAHAHVMSRLGPDMMTDDPADADFVVLPGQRGWVVIGDFDGTIRSVVAGAHQLSAVGDIIVGLCEKA